VAQFGKVEAPMRWWFVSFSEFPKTKVGEVAVALIPKISWFIMNKESAIPFVKDASRQTTESNNVQTMAKEQPLSLICFLL